MKRLPELNDALEDLRGLNLHKVAARIDESLPRGDESLEAQLIALSRVRDLVEIVQITLDAAQPKMGDEYDLIRIDILQALATWTYKVIHKAA